MTAEILDIGLFAELSGFASSLLDHIQNVLFPKFRVEMDFLVVLLLLEAKELIVLVPVTLLHESIKLCGLVFNESNFVLDV